MVSIKSVDLAIFIKNEKINSKNIRYFTGVESDNAILFLTKKRKQLLFLSSLEKKPKNKNICVKNLEQKRISDAVKKLKPKTVGLVYSETSKASFDFFKKLIPKAKFKDISVEINSLRRTKTSKEIKQIKQAVSKTEQLFEKIFKKIAFLQYEDEVIQLIKEELNKKELEESFKPIIASGKNSKNPHYYPKKNSKLKKGFCIIDIGVKYDAYCADMTRTIFLGKASSKEKEYYESVRKEQEKIEQSAKQGSKIIKTTFRMIHALGHGIGLDVHEQPFVGVEKLEENDCIAIEPARYDKKYGVRIEDNYLVKKNKLVRLSYSSRTLKEISFTPKV